MNIGGEKRINYLYSLTFVDRVSFITRILVDDPENFETFLIVFKKNIVSEFFFLRLKELIRFIIEVAASLTLSLLY